MIAYSLKYEDGGVMATAQLFSDAVGVFYVSYPYWDEQDAIGVLDQLVTDLGFRDNEMVKVKDVRMENPSH